MTNTHKTTNIFEKLKKSSRLLSDFPPGEDVYGEGENIEEVSSGRSAGCHLTTTINSKKTVKQTESKKFITYLKAMGIKCKILRIV